MIEKKFFCVFSFINCTKKIKYPKIKQLVELKTLNYFYKILLLTQNIIDI